MSRYVYVDDTDPGITYTGPWFLDHGSQNSVGTDGQPHLGTLHGTDSDASFSYSFNGTEVFIYGTNQFQDLSGVTNPSWQCIVDGVSVPSANVTVPENNLVLCEEDSLSDGPHVITVNVTVSNQQTFWFDSILYLPSPSMSLAQVSLFISTDDSQLQYGTGWSPISFGNMTGQTGSTFSFEFNGTSLTWLGFYLDTLPNASTTATYAVDGEPPITFNLNASAFSTLPEYLQIFFQTAQLSSGPHQLDVVYQGNSATTPLTLEGLYVQNNALSSSTSASGTPNASTNGSINVGSIIGGVVGGFGLLIFIILAILFLRHRNNRSKNTHVSTIVEPGASSPLIPGQPQRRQETRAVSPSYVTGNNFQPTSLQVREEDAGIIRTAQGAGTDQDGYFR